MAYRVAFIEYFPVHYRRGLYEELSRRMDVDVLFYSDERERWQSRAIKADPGGDYRSVTTRHYWILGQAVSPGAVARLTSERYDAVIKSLNGKLMFPATYLRARQAGVPFVLWTGMWHHPQTLAHRLTRGVTESAYRSADAIVAEGNHVKRVLAAVPGVDDQKIFVDLPAAEGAPFEAVAPLSEAARDVLFVGQFKQYKGVGVLLRAWDMLDRGDCRLRLVGDGPLADEIAAHAHGRSDIEIVGHVPYDRLPGEFAGARCLVLPSVTTKLNREPWGMVVNEAMHAGRPVVASTSVGAAASGLVRDGQNGFIVPERDPHALASALDRLIRDPGLASTLGAQARVDVGAYTYGRMADGFEQGVAYAVQRRRGR